MIKFDYRGLEYTLINVQKNVANRFYVFAIDESNELVCLTISDLNVIKPIIPV